MSHNSTMVHKQIRIPGAMKSSAAKTADKGWDKLRMKQLHVSVVWSMVFHVSVPLARRARDKLSRHLKLKTSQILQDSSVGVTPNIPHSSPTSASFFSCPQSTERQWHSRSSFLHPWYEDQEDFARVMASTREISRFGGGPMAQSHAQVRHTKKQNIDYAGTADWLVQKVELRKDFTFANYHRQHCLLHHPTAPHGVGPSHDPTALFLAVKTTESSFQAETGAYHIVAACCHNHTGIMADVDARVLSCFEAESGERRDHVREAPTTAATDGEARAVDAVRIQEMLSFVHEGTDEMTHAHHCRSCLILTLHQARSMPKHTSDCIPSSTAHIQSW